MRLDSSPRHRLGHGALLLFWLGAAAPTLAGDSMTPDQQAVTRTVERMAAAFAAGHIDTILHSDEPDAAVVFDPQAPPTVGSDALRQAFQAAATAAPQFTFDAHEVVVAGDIALHLAPWRMQAAAPDGSTLHDRGLSVAVIRRQPDGSWRMVIDHPQGAHLLQAHGATP
jgi:uncharacterized protein (TIGR02246 family)